MKIPFSILVVPVLVFISACSTHYSASSHHNRHGHVSVGVHGHHHGNAGNVLGALIVGGIIGHMITEAANEDERRHVSPPVSDEQDELVNGYPIEQSNQAVPVEEQRYYQLGEDGACYLMEDIDGESKVVAMVPKYSCNG